MLGKTKKNPLLTIPRKCANCGKLFLVYSTNEKEWGYAVDGLGLCCSWTCQRALERRGHTPIPLPGISRMQAQIIREGYRRGWDADTTARRSSLTAQAVSVWYEHLDEEA